MSSFDPTVLYIAITGVALPVSDNAGRSQAIAFSKTPARPSYHVNDTATNRSANQRV
jgi:hypothetical protein